MFSKMFSEELILKMRNAARTTQRLQAGKYRTRRCFAISSLG